MVQEVIEEPYTWGVDPRKAAWEGSSKQGVNEDGNSDEDVHSRP